jgi:Uma2 family endonuclease
MEMTPATLAEPIVVPGPPFRDEALYEVVDGQRVELLPMGVYETDIANKVGRSLGLFVEAHHLGRVEIEMLFDLAVVRRQRRPDVAFVPYDRWPRDRRMPRGNAWAVVPALAVEVVSPSNTMEEVLVKVPEYFRAGVQGVWVVLPDLAQVYVYESPTQVRVLTIADELGADALLPGFRLAVATLFEAEAASEQPGNAQPPATESAT